MAVDSAATKLVNIFAAPAEAFRAIRERPQAWVPLLILIAGVTIVSLLYMTSVDLGWFLENQMRSSGRALTDAQIKQAVDAASRLPPVVYGGIASVTSALAILLFTAIGALYYTGVSFVTGDGVRFKQWYGLVCWCMLPTLLGIVAQLVNLLANDPRFMVQDAINPLAFGNLLGIDRTGATILQRVLLGIDVTSLWGLLLAVVGYQTFSKSSLVKAAVIVLAPLAVIVAVGSAIAFLRNGG
jgi:hypothetical protein